MIAALVAFVGLVLALVVVANVTGCCRRPKGRAEPRSLLVVLGSGGHTAEMMKLLPAIDSGRFHPRHFVAAATDITSESRAKARKVRGADMSRRPAIPPEGREPVEASSPRYPWLPPSWDCCL